jgi:ATP-binding cassette subfamily B protein/subfamily B ATP-binding cassette protein MsbA
VRELAADLFAHLQRLTLRYHTRSSVGDLLGRLTTDTWALYTLSSNLFVTPLQHLLTISAVAFVAWRLDPYLAVVSLGAAPILGISATLFGRRMRARALRSREAQSRLLAFVHQTLSALPLVRAFGTEAANGERFGRLAAESTAQSQRGVLLREGYTASNLLALTIGSAIVLTIGGRRVLDGALSVGSLLVFLAYLKTVQDATQALLTAHVNVTTASASARRVLEVLDAEEVIRERPGAVVLPRGRGHVRLEAVTVGYEPGRPVLHELSLEARPGETIALVGATGAGKSTLVALLPRFLDPWRGRVVVDGHDVRDVQLASLRAQVALVLQEPMLLPLSVAENLAYGRPGATASTIEAAARAAHAHEFIARLPAGYATVLGERGATLSGGQRQRLAIARALVRDAPLLVLDEPTSALDAETEGLLLDALRRLMQNRTTFIIAHRLSTIRGADQIVVLGDGRILEQGTHAALLAANGPFARLYALQLDHSTRPAARSGLSRTGAVR